MPRPVADTQYVALNKLTWIKEEHHSYTHYCDIYAVTIDLQAFKA